MPSELDLDVTANLKACFDHSSDDYERRIGACTRAVTKIILSLLLPLPPNPVVLDNVCGTAAFTHEIIGASSEAYVHAVDTSSGMIDITKSIIQEKGWLDEVEADVMDAGPCAFERGYSTLLSQISRYSSSLLLKPGGSAAVTTWK